MCSLSGLEWANVFMSLMEPVTSSAFKDVHRRQKLTRKLFELTILVVTISMSKKYTYHGFRGSFLILIELGGAPPLGFFKRCT